MSTGVGGKNFRTGGVTNLGGLLLKGGGGGSVPQYMSWGKILVSSEDMFGIYQFSGESFLVHSRPVNERGAIALASTDPRQYLWRRALVAIAKLYITDAP